MIEFSIVMSTVDRPGNQYLYETLKSFDEKTSIGPIPMLVVGSPDRDYIKSSYPIVPMQEKEWGLAKDKGKCEKFNLNFYRCLRFGAENVLYLEDDLNFKFNWDHEFKDKITQLHEQHEDFVLSIYSPYDLSKSPTEFVHFDRGFYGTQAVYITKGIKDKLAEKVMDEGILNYRHMADILLQEFCTDNKIPLYATKTPLVQHIGKESAIHNNTFHQAPNF